MRTGKNFEKKIQIDTEIIIQKVCITNLMQTGYKGTQKRVGKLVLDLT